jgi:hypothetical protein
MIKFLLIAWFGCAVFLALLMWGVYALLRALRGK